MMMSTAFIGARKALQKKIPTSLSISNAVQYRSIVSQILAKLASFSITG